MSELNKHFSWREWIISAIAVLAIICLFTYRPIRQSSAYHNFADCRHFWGINHFGDVISNLPFIIIGTWGLSFLKNPKSTECFECPSEKNTYVFFFTGLLLTVFGSTYYHLEPNSKTLFWNRLPMSVSFMSFLCITIGEFINPKLALKVLFPAVAFGMGSVIYWIWSEFQGMGDWRFYLFTQFFGIISLPLILLMYKSRYRFNYYWFVLFFYILAKICESKDW